MAVCNSEADPLSLLEQLQNATEGSRELSDALLLACGWCKDTITDRKAEMTYWRYTTPDGERGDPFGHAPDPTQNLQDAVSLVRERFPRHLLTVQYDPDDDESTADLLGPEWVGGPETGGTYRPGPEVVLKGDQMALALCIAIINAHESKEAEEGLSKVPEIRRIAEADDGALEGDL